MAKKRASAGGRIKEQGKSLVWVTFSSEEKAKIRMAAASQDLPMSQFLRNQGLAAAEKILAKIPSGS